MRHRRGFTVIEFLIVFCIIALLIVMIVPMFFRGCTRSKLSRVRSDMRSMATAIETYFVDHSAYPAMSLDPKQQVDGHIKYYKSGKKATLGRTFRAENGTGLATLTTPVAYLTDYFPDPDSEPGATLRYYTDGDGWILGAFGWDGDPHRGGQLLWNRGTIEIERPFRVLEAEGIEAVYDSSIPQPSPLLQTGVGPNGAFTFDPTNGTVSPGDLWRVKQ